MSDTGRTAVLGKISYVFLPWLFRRLPIPGRYANIAGLVLQRHFESPTGPLIVWNRNRKFRVEIQDLNDFIQRSIFFAGYIEYRETRFVQSVLRPGDCFVDVGANIGWFTLLAASLVGPTGRVVSFEPANVIREQLAKNVSLNRLQQVTIEPFGLSDVNGFAELVAGPPGNLGHTSFLPDHDALGRDRERVPIIRFSEYCKDHALDHVRLMKVDVEGYEQLVLRGMEDMLRPEFVESLLIEIDDQRLRRLGSSSFDVLAYIASRGYELCHPTLSGLRPIHSKSAAECINVIARARAKSGG
jgi:FkbM family methyltransferase